MTDTINLLTKEDLDNSSFDNNDTFKQGGISVKISTEQGNILEKKITGLYVRYPTKIEELPQKNDEFLQDIYVKNNGNDNAKGTKEAPLKTINAAFSKIKPYTSGHIHLFEGETHEWLASNLENTSNKNYSFSTYGDTLDNALASVDTKNINEYYDAYRAQELNRATLKLVHDTPISNFNLYPRVYNNTTSYQYINEYKGLNIDISSSASNEGYIQYDQHAYIGTPNHGQNMFFVGCNFIMGGLLSFIQIGDYSRIELDSCNFKNNTNSIPLILLNAGGDLNLIITGSNKTKGSMLGVNGVLTNIETAGSESWKQLIISNQNDSRLLHNIKWGK